MNPLDYDATRSGVAQVYRMGKHYEEWADKPMRGFGADDSIVVFGGPLELLTYTPVWMPVAWVAVGLWVAFSHASGLGWCFFWLISGLAGAWPLLEYALHRWVFHLDTSSGSGLRNVLHFLLHGIHHKTPKDTSRLLAPLPLVLVFALPIYLALCALLPISVAGPLFGGILLGYVQYDYSHLYLHTPGRKPAALREWAKRHLHHHSKNHHRYYGVSLLSNALWDPVFHTD